MTLKQALACAREILTSHKIDDARIESELLLRHALNITRIQLYLSLENELGPEQEATYLDLVGRRAKSEPTAYIIRNREFYGLDFYVDSRVLIPRPESEILVEKALEFARNHPVHTIADIGTGCGAIAICLAINLPTVRIFSTDLSADALDVARFNCEKHKVVDRIKLIQGDLMEPLHEPVDLIVSNMPYVRKVDLPVMETAGFEPALALDGGVSGLDKISQLCYQASDKLRPNGCLLLEIGAGQKEAVVGLLQGLFPSATIAVTKDLGGIERVVSLTLEPTGNRKQRP